SRSDGDSAGDPVFEGDGSTRREPASRSSSGVAVRVGFGTDAVRGATGAGISWEGAERRGSGTAAGDVCGRRPSTGGAAGEGADEGVVNIGERTAGMGSGAASGASSSRRRGDGMTGMRGWGGMTTGGPSGRERSIGGGGCAGTAYEAPGGIER